jgi:hypothetical protein
MSAVQQTEQTLLPLVQALNSNPLPVDRVIELYNTLRGVPTLSIPEDEVELQAFYLRYREQVDQVLSQGTDLHNHLLEIQQGEAAQTEVSPIHLSLARDATSAGTSQIQGLLRELETFVAAQP